MTEPRYWSRGEGGTEKNKQIVRPILAVDVQYLCNPEPSNHTLPQLPKIQKWRTKGGGREMFILISWGL